MEVFQLHGYLVGHLKVGSCPNDDNSVQIFIWHFLCSI